MNKFIIRNIEEKDIPSVVDIKINSWRTAYKGIIDDNYLKSLCRDDNIKKIKENYKENGFIIAELNNEVVGFCRYVDSNKFTKDISDIDCEILALYVRPDLKYNGIGTRLFKYVITNFKVTNKNKMILWCLKENEPSRRFYLKMGGKISYERPFKIGENQYYEIGFTYNI